MRPDLDDYEDLSPEVEAERSRGMSWIVLGIAVIGFGALAYYAYQSGSQSAGDGNVLIVQAEPGVIKEAPADPGGEEFANQDKTIYDAVSPTSDEPTKVETLLPEPEEPVIPGVAPAAPVVVAEPAPAPVAPAPEPAPVAETPVAPPVVVAEPAPIAEPVKEPVKEVVKEAPKPEKKPAAVKPKPATGNFKIQLGAFRSEAEARSVWKSITAKHGGTVKGTPIIARADLPNGVFYRLRAGGFASEKAAKDACAKLDAAGQACFYVGK